MNSLFLLAISQPHVRQSLSHISSSHSYQSNHHPPRRGRPVVGRGVWPVGATEKASPYGEQSVALEYLPGAHSTGYPKQEDALPSLPPPSVMGDLTPALLTGSDIV